jgi:hypothetical protein
MGRSTRRAIEDIGAQNRETAAGHSKLYGTLDRSRTEQKGNVKINIYERFSER